MSTELIRTAFDGPQRELGCDFMDWEGWLWPNHFGDPAAEHRAVRQGVGIWDESPLRKWDFRGREALQAADRIFTNDMLGLEPGRIRYAPFCDADGKMVGDGTVFNFGDLGPGTSVAVHVEATTSLPSNWRAGERLSLYDLKSI